MLELKNVSFKGDGKEILKNINLKIDENIFVAITGPNGSGKSTLAKIIMGIERCDKGKIIFNGEDITVLSLDERAKRGIAFAFQQPVRFKGITVYDMLKLAASDKLTKEEACAVLGRVGMCAKEYVNRELNSSLSGGELKRIEIASVILRDAPLTIFDEPEAGIDLWSFANLIKVFRDVQKARVGSTLVITHQERILDIADNIILLEAGELKYYGARDKIIDSLYESTDCKKLAGGCRRGCK